MQRLQALAKSMSGVIFKILQSFVRCLNEEFMQLIVIWACHKLCNTPARQNCFHIYVPFLANRKLQVNCSRSKKWAEEEGFEPSSPKTWDINSWTELPFWKKLQLFFGWTRNVLPVQSIHPPASLRFTFLVLLCSFFTPKPEQQIENWAGLEWTLWWNEQYKCQPSN